MLRSFVIISLLLAGKALVVGSEAFELTSLFESQGRHAGPLLLFEELEHVGDLRGEKSGVLTGSSGFFLSRWVTSCWRRSETVFSTYSEV